MRVSALRPHVQPFTLKGKVAECDPEEQETKEKKNLELESALLVFKSQWLSANCES